MTFVRGAATSVRMTVLAAFVAAALLMLLAGPAGAAEAPSTAAAATLLGADAMGANWTVQPQVRSDGLVRLFNVTTPYGDFQVNGQRRMNERVAELKALQALDKMSRTGAFADALGRAGMAPIRFGRDLIVDPVETTGNVVSGIGKMFQNVAATVSGEGTGRNSLLARISGVTAAERELAFKLGVDPYTDFTPLRDGLNDVAKAAAAGGLSVTAAISAIPGGAGIAASATQTASDFAGSVESKTSDEIAKLVTEKLTKLGATKAATDTFVMNKFYSPNDQYAIADALERLNASNSAAFVTVAAGADSYDVAKFHRYRAELLAKESARLGTVKEFVAVDDMALNRDASGRLVAVFPFDAVEWTEPVAKSMTKLSDEATKLGGKRVFATTGTMSATASAELKSRGWELAGLN